ncbi:ATP-binding protein [Glaciimonas sp. PAMC28666]|uniref:ATP-binding protein n=1 Tax=Glaciimonas sp. PAMC28666 TaxID=2807626 RepID=UPI0019632FF9|nr:ATP-binding protein [Glaciimonas sp. PAMC28666]QRX82513.1 ATP-binding protein [Glaciimonas sp. PAMC28666]
MMKLEKNGATLARELAWAGQLIDVGLRLHFGDTCDYQHVRQIAPPALLPDDSAYADTLLTHAMSFDERLILVLALAPHLQPDLFDPFLIKNALTGRNYTEFGGIISGSHSGFWPSIETGAFILTGGDMVQRLALKSLFTPEHFFRRHKLLDLSEETDATRSLSVFGQALKIGHERLDLLTSGGVFQPTFSNSFPAQRLTCKLGWGDLILAQTIREEVEEIKAWIEHGPTLMQDWQLDKHLKPGFRSLFYGPPGTGKTLTATLLGKATGLDVYRVDLAMVVSKFIGETEKNLGSVFDQAENHDWILFFDEADALFGKRTQTSNSNDRHANSQVAYLLQRIEDFPGVVILASNLKANIDDAFARRFQSMIYFPMPRLEERLQLWRNAFSQPDRLDASVDLQRIAEEFELTGGAIINVLRYAALNALRRADSDSKISQIDIRNGCKRELRKDGKVL